MFKVKNLKKLVSHKIKPHLSAKNFSWLRLVYNVITSSKYIGSHKNNLKYTKSLFKSTEVKGFIPPIFTVSIFSGGLSDAIDIDFGEGSIESSQFKFSGNDAIDVSGSKVNLKNIFISHAGDKGISAGENSTVNAENIKILDSNIAVSSKDKSRIKLNVIRIENVTIGLSAYQKKNEFGPGFISLHGLSHEGVQKLHLVEKNSEIYIDDVQVLEKHLDIKKYLYPSQN